MSHGPNVLDHEVGTLLAHLVQAGAQAQTVARFVTLQMGLNCKSESEALLGQIIIDVVTVGAPTDVIGKLASSLLQQQRSPQISSLATSPVGSRPRQLTTQDVVRMVDEMLASNQPKNPKSDRVVKKYRVSVNGRHTSVLLELELVEQFKQLFNQKRLRELLNEIGASADQPGVSRTERVRRQILELVVQRQAASYPHGLKLIQGGQV
jgi:hypothetical protein